MLNVFKLPSNLQMVSLKKSNNFITLFRTQLKTLNDEQKWAYLNQSLSFINKTMSQRQNGKYKMLIVKIYIQFKE